MATKTRIDPAHTETKPSALLDAIGLTVLGKLVSEKESKANRALLEPALHKISLTIGGTINGKQWSHCIGGTLCIAPDGAPQASSSTPWAELLHSAVCVMSASDRQAWLEEVSKGGIPEPKCSDGKAATVSAELEPALKAYRSTNTITKKGNVTFTRVTQA